MLRKSQCGSGSGERLYDRELDAVFVEAVDQCGFGERGSWGVNSSPESRGQSRASASEQTGSVMNIMDNRGEDSRFR